MRHIGAWGASALALLAASCGDAGESATGTTSDPGGSAGAGPGGTGGAGGGSGGSEMVCPAGQAPSGSGVCNPVGIPGCAAIFLDADGVCRPSMKKCAGQPGTIPRFAEGCVPVGIPGCAPAFLGEDGFCRPSMKKCPEGAFAVPQLGCVPIDGPEGCGDGTWGNIPDGPNTRYVDPSYAGATSDGTQGMPYKNLSSAVASVPPGTTLALAAGIYDEQILIGPKPVTIEGRCPSMTQVTPPQGFTAISINGTVGVVLRRLHVVGAGGVGIFAGNGAEVTVDSVHVSNATSFGIRAYGAAVTVTNSFIDDTQPFSQDAGEWSTGMGVLVDVGGVVHLTDSAVTRSHSVGIWALDAGSQLTAVDVLVEGTLSDVLNGYGGAGIQIQSGASVSMKWSAASGNQHSGVLAFSPGANVEIVESALVGNQPQTVDGRLGCGVNVQQGGHAVVTRNAILENTYNGMLAYSEGETSILESRGNLIAKTKFPDESRFGIGAVVQASSEGTFEDDVFFENSSAGFFLYSAPATAALSRVLIEGTLTSPGSGQDGGGVLAFLSGPISMQSCAIVDNHVGAVGIVFASGSVSDSLLSGTKSGSILDDMGELHEDFGDGLIAGYSDSVSIERTVVERNARAGIFHADAGGVIQSCEIRGNAYGLVLQSGADPEIVQSSLAFWGNTTADFVEDGDLKVPSGPSELP